MLKRIGLGFAFLVDAVVLFHEASIQYGISWANSGASACTGCCLNRPQKKEDPSKIPAVPVTFQKKVPLAAAFLFKNDFFCGIEMSIVTKPQFLLFILNLCQDIRLQLLWPKVPKSLFCRHFRNRCFARAHRILFIYYDYRGLKGVLNVSFGSYLTNAESLQMGLQNTCKQHLKPLFLYIL